MGLKQNILGKLHLMSYLSSHELYEVLVEIKALCYTADHTYNTEVINRAFQDGVTNFSMEKIVDTGEVFSEVLEIVVHPEVFYRMKLLNLIEVKSLLDVTCMGIPVRIDHTGTDADEGVYATWLMFEDRQVAIMTREKDRCNVVGR